MLPVSSTAHLRLALGATPDAALVSTALHAGSALGTAWAVRGDLPALLRHPLPLVAATVPPIVAGGLLAGRGDRWLGGRRVTAATLALGGLALVLADRRAPATRRRSDVRDALAAGLAQAAALAPGVSRSGAVLTVLRLRGVGRAPAVRRATLLGLPVTAGAVLRAAAAVEPAAVRAAVGPLAVGAAAAAGVTAVTLGPAHRLLGRADAAPAVATYRTLLAGVVLRRRGPLAG